MTPDPPPIPPLPPDAAPLGTPTSAAVGVPAAPPIPPLPADAASVPAAPSEPATAPGASARQLDADPDLGRRRRKAHRRAVISFAEGLVIGALFAAGIALVLFAGAARLETWATSEPYGDAKVWTFLPGGAASLAALLLAASAAFLAFAGVRGGGRFHLKGIATRPPQAPTEDRYRNVVDALSLGLGTPTPTLEVIDDPVPNAISGRDGRRTRLLVTSGAIADLTREQLEALCAHELAHLHAADARMVGAAYVTLARVHALAITAAAGGALTAAGGFQGDAWSLMVVGVGIVIVSGIALLLLNRPLLRLRRATDDVADCVAVHLSHHPTALAVLLGTLKADTRQVGATTDRNQYLWFETAADTQLDQRQANALATANGLPGRF